MQETYGNESYNTDGAEYSNGELLSQAQPPQQSPQYDRVIQEEKVANFISQTSPSKNLDKIDKILRGFFYDQEQKKWVKVNNGIPEQMRVDYLQLLTPYLSEDVRMGRMDRQSINKIMEMVIEFSIDYLDIEADYYEINAKGEFVRTPTAFIQKEYKFDYWDGWVEVNKSKEQKIKIHEIPNEQLSKINYIVCSAVAFVLWRAENGVERDRMYNSLKLGDNFQEYAKQEEKKSLLASILPWK